jgi:NitT/TauT family transport system substrate-binding protein
MSNLPFDRVTRRKFLANASALSAASLLGLPRAANAEPPPETTRVRVVKVPAICLAPEYLAEELLRLEGFSEIEYVEVGQSTSQDLLVANKADFSVLVPPAVAACPGCRTTLGRARRAAWRLL